LFFKNKKNSAKQKSEQFSKTKKLPAKNN